MNARFAGKIVISHFCTYENEGNRELLLRGKTLTLFFGRLLRGPQGGQWIHHLQEERYLRRLGKSPHIGNAEPLRVHWALKRHETSTACRQEGEEKVG